MASNSHITKAQIIEILDDLTEKADNRFAAKGEGGGGSDEDIFNLEYGLCNSNATIRKVNGNTVISKTDIDKTITAVSTIVETSSTVTTITTVVTPNEGNYKYTETTTITTVDDGTNIQKRYTRSTK